ncbi:hypothetical protein [Aquibacillus albus]|uniref:Type II secretion system protein n=1 Tax=Aquibacillus albus TaxID=1168171 RepID=A0ABS2MUV8_9BACI|nr:hypothetical protein [Aquibacillus albus]MBM7569677.1 hypothetical protein [Aquibacillus albus]
MKNNSSGFHITEVLICLAIFSTIMFSLIPILSQIKVEEVLLSHRRNAQSILHDELLYHIWASSQLEFPISYQKNTSIGLLHLTFEFEEELMKGCVKWKNAKTGYETSCLYGYP